MILATFQSVTTMGFEHKFLLEKSAKYDLSSNGQLCQDIPSGITQNWEFDEQRGIQGIMSGHS